MIRFKRLRLFFQAQNQQLTPVAQQAWRIGLIVILAAALLDVALPHVAVPPVMAVAVLVGLSTVAWSPWVTLRLTFVALLADVLTLTFDVWHSHITGAEIRSRLLIGLLIVVVGFLGSRLVRQNAGMPSNSPSIDEVPTGPLLERAAGLLAHLCQARSMLFQRIDNVTDAVERMDLRVPVQRPRWWQSLLPPTNLTLGLEIPREEQAVWITESGHVLVKFHCSGHGEALVRLIQPRAPHAFIEDAARVLQMQLERAALLEEVHSQRELLRDLVYAFSHDLRTPITASILNAQAALGGAYGPISAEMREVITNSLASQRGLLNISDQLMLVAEYESGGPSGDEHAPVPLEPLIRAVIADELTRLKSQAIYFELTPEKLCVNGYQYDLRRAIQNLIDNAVKFSPPSAAIRVYLFRSGDQAVIEVCDDGPGVSPAHEARLFQRFRHSSAGSGTGLGLYLTSRIIERHRGTVTYRRDVEPPQTVFSLRLPTVTAMDLG